MRDMEKFFKLMNHNAAISQRARETEMASGTESDMDDSVSMNTNNNNMNHIPISENQSVSDLFTSPAPVLSTFSFTSIVNTQPVTTNGVSTGNGGGTYLDMSDEGSATPLIVLKKYVSAMKKRLEDLSRKCVRQEESLKASKREFEESKLKVVSTEQNLQRTSLERQVRHKWVCLKRSVYLFLSFFLYSLILFLPLYIIFISISCRLWRPVLRMQIRMFFNSVPPQHHSTLRRNYSPQLPKTWHRKYEASYATLMGYCPTLCLGHTQQQVGMRHMVVMY